MNDEPQSVSNESNAESGEVTVHYAKTHLSRLLREVAAGAEYVISRGDTPVARLVPMTSAAPERVFGVLRETLCVPSSFLTPLSNDELDAWQPSE